MVSRSQDTWSVARCLQERCWVGGEVGVGNSYDRAIIFWVRGVGGGNVGWGRGR